MARILYSGVVSELKGSVKGTTYQRNCSGSIAKGKNNARFKASDWQASEQKVFAYLSGLWNSTPFGYKDEWNSFAADYQRTDFWGNLKNITGYQWFLSINRAAYLIGAEWVDQPPDNNDTAALPVIHLGATSSNVYAYFNSPQDLSGMMCVVMCSGPRRSTANTSRQPYIFMDYDGDDVIETIDFTDRWEEVFGIAWGDYYALDQAGLIGWAYSINLDNFVSSEYSPMAWSKL